MPMVPLEVLEATVRPFCEHLEYVDEQVKHTNRLLRAMAEPPGAMTPGPGPMRYQEPSGRRSGQMIRVRNGGRSDVRCTQAGKQIEAAKALRTQTVLPGRSAEAVQNDYLAPGRHRVRPGR